MSREDELQRHDDATDEAESTTKDAQKHATTGGAAAAGAVTGGVVGLAGGPAGAAIGAVGGAIIGAAAERIMHRDDDAERTRSGLDDDRDVQVTREGGVIDRQPIERTVSDTPVGQSERSSIRREDLRVGQEGEARVVGWDDAMPRYRSHWQQRFGTSGGQWQEEEPAYRYGWEMRNQPANRGRAWTDVEADARREWTTRHPDKPWDRARESIRDAWENATD